MISFASAAPETWESHRGSRLPVGILLAAAIVTGCSAQPVALPAGQDGLPGRLGFRQLYRTPRACVYASNDAAARWMTTWLDQHVGDIERRCGVQVRPGLVIVLAPGESLVFDRLLSGKSHLPMEPALELTGEEMPVLVGLPGGSWERPYHWCFVLPTDDYLGEAVRRYFRDFDREHPAALRRPEDAVFAFTMLLARPIYSARYVTYGRAQRKYALAKAVAAVSTRKGPERDRALAAVESIWRPEYEKARYALEHVD